MKNKTINIFFLLTIIVQQSIYAQRTPDFKKYGFDFKVATLSNGKYCEFFDQDTIVKIGNVLFNTQSNKIVDIAKPDTSYHQIPADVISRWMSPDPLAEEYESFSPYHFSGNNPIRFVDLNGMNYGDFFDRSGKYLGTDGIKDGKIYVLNEGYKANTENSSVNWGGQLSETHIDDLKSKSAVISMNSDLGYMTRTVYSEMRGGDNNAKSIVAESIHNRSEMKSSYEKADGTYKGIVNKFYDVSKSGNESNDVFKNPVNYIYKNPSETNAWRNSVEASLKAHFDISDVGKGVIFYNSVSSTYYDKNSKMEKITLDYTVKGIKGLWKIR